MSEILTINSVDDSIRLVHDRIVVRNGEGELLRRFTAAESFAVLLTAKRLIHSIELSSSGTGGATASLPDSPIKVAAGSNVNSGWYITITLPVREGLGRVVVNGGELNKLVDSLTHNIGHKEFRRRVSGYRWDNNKKELQAKNAA